MNSSFLISTRIRPQMKLNIGDSRIITVSANKKYSCFPKICVEKDEEYSFDINDEQEWRDSWKVTSARGFWNPFLSNKDKRVSDARCFELCGTVNKNESNHFRIGLGKKEVPIEESGDIQFFANDHMHDYHNNSGCIVIKLTRTK